MKVFLLGSNVEIGHGIGCQAELQLHVVTKEVGSSRVSLNAQLVPCGSLNHC